MKFIKAKSHLIDYIFWFTFILFTNPGGILQVLGEDKEQSGIDYKDLLFVVLFICYVLIYTNRFKIKDYAFDALLKYMIFFAIYHFLVFAFFTPSFKGSSNTLSFIILKNRHELYSFILVIITYEFYLRSSRIFLKFFLLSSIVLLALFIGSILTGFEILPTLKGERGFIKINRIFLYSYGLMPLLIPIGAALLAFKIKVKYKNVILVGFSFMFLTWLLSLTRRHIFGTIVYFVIAFVLNNYILRKNIIPLNRIFSIAFSTMIFLAFIYLTFPKYIDAGIKTVEETFYVIKHGENSVGQKDARLGFGKGVMQDLILDNLFFGTGFDNRWRTSGGDKAGYETSDYPFLAALAMKGVIGVIIFLPIYILLLKCLIFDVQFLRNNSYNRNSIEYLIFVFFIVYYIFELMRYMDWFMAVSLTKGWKWYVIIAMYFASRYLFYESVAKEKLNC